MLNGQYEGQATGETFNVTGKTDILIWHEGRNIFIAECKIWDGPQSLIEAIDQIISYSSWRDTKTAILLFNKNRQLTQVICKINEIIQSHRNYKRKYDLNKVSLRTETIFSNVYHQSSDVNREMIITTMVYDVPETLWNLHWSQAHYIKLLLK
jgi:hypothetical protein